MPDTMPRRQCVIVLANAADTLEFAQSGNVPGMPRGIDWLASADSHASTKICEALPNLGCVVAHLTSDEKQALENMTETVATVVSLPNRVDPVADNEEPSTSPTEVPPPLTRTTPEFTWIANRASVTSLRLRGFVGQDDIASDSAGVRRLADAYRTGIHEGAPVDTSALLAKLQIPKSKSWLATLLPTYLQRLDLAHHRLRATGRGVRVAVLDTGLAPTLAKPYSFGFDPSSGSQACFLYGEASTHDSHGHGTRMAGLINGRKGTTVIGPAPDCTIIPIKVMRKAHAVDLRALLAGLEFAVREHADIASMSLGMTAEVPTGALNATLWHYVATRLRGHGVLPIAAVGNHGQRPVQHPAACKSVVGATSIHDGKAASYANVGSSVDLAADARKTISAYPHDWGPASGWVVSDTYTSGSCALVAGIAALVREAFKDATLDEIEQRLRDASEQGTYADTPNRYVGWGMVSAKAAIP